ncbi:hypothetical protein DERF_012232 [Dermatophagoides farinae]|uniref:Uncharacterized protein n=1 Tax=Dermatophagoides farinae TaxID=6954 RepID=A0A922HPI6_DERFA|nr:hypothetical protein DERF_012232 [Dermatophagoides farinae]
MIHPNLVQQQDGNNDDAEDEDDDDDDDDDKCHRYNNCHSFDNCRHSNQYPSTRLSTTINSNIIPVEYYYYQQQQQNDHSPLLLSSSSSSSFSSSFSSCSSSSSSLLAIEPPQAFQDYGNDNITPIISSTIDTQTPSMLYPVIDDDDNDDGDDEDGDVDADCTNQQPINDFIVTHESSSSSPLVIFPYESHSTVSTVHMLNNNDDLLNSLSSANNHQTSLSSSPLLPLNTLIANNTNNNNDDDITIALYKNNQQQYQPCTEFGINNNHNYTQLQRPTSHQHLSQTQLQTAISNQLLLNATQYRLYRRFIQQQQMNQESTIATMINHSNVDNDANNVVGTNTNCMNNKNRNNVNINEITTTTTTTTSSSSAAVSAAVAKVTTSSIIDSSLLSSSSLMEMNPHSHHHQQYFFYSTPPPPPSSPLILANTSTIAANNVIPDIDKNIVVGVVNNSDNGGNGDCVTGSLNNLPNICYDSSPTLSTYHHYPHHQQHYYNHHHQQQQQQQHHRQHYQYRPPHHRLHPHQLERYGSSSSLNHRNGSGIMNNVNNANINGSHHHHHHHHHHLMMNNAHLYHTQQPLLQSPQQAHRSFNTGNGIVDDGDGGSNDEVIANSDYRSSSLPSNNHTKVLIHHQCSAAITPPSYTPPLLSMHRIRSSIDNTNCSVKSLPIEHNHQMNIVNGSIGNSDETYCHDIGETTLAAAAAAGTTITTMSNCRTQSTSPRPPSSTTTTKPSSLGKPEPLASSVQFSEEQAMVLAMVEEQAKQEAQLRELKGYEASAKYQPPLIDGAVAAALLTQSGTIIPDNQNQHKRSCSEWRMTLFVFYWIIWIVFLIGVVIIVAANTRTE